jgi:hypothetical protein
MAQISVSGHKKHATAARSSKQEDKEFWLRLAQDWEKLGEDADKLAERQRLKERPERK